MSQALEIVKLLGQSAPGEEVAKFFAELGVQPEEAVDDFEIYISSREMGFTLFAQSNRVEVIFLYGVVNDKGVKPFLLGMPGALTVHDSRSEVRRKLGTPFRSWDGGGKSRIYAIEPPFDLFNMNDFLLRAQYRADFQEITQVQLMVSDFLDLNNLPQFEDSLLPNGVENWMSKVPVFLESNPGSLKTLQEIRKLLVPTLGLLELKKMAGSAPIELVRLPYHSARDLCAGLNRIEPCLSLRDPRDPGKVLRFRPDEG